MATGPLRPTEDLTAGLARWMAAHPALVPGGAGPGPVLLSHAEGGMANETLLVDLGPGHPGVVVRLPPLQATFPDYDLEPQVLVQNAVAAAGVPAPAPAVVVHDLDWIGSPFLVMPRVAGRVPGGAPVLDPWIMGLPETHQRALHDAFIDALAAIHAVDWSAQGLGPVLADHTAAAAVGRWQSYVEWAGEGEPLPALTETLDWCAAHLPGDDSAPVLLWGDVRLGNVVVGDDLALQAILDWDLASIGPPGMDLGWYFGLEFMMGQLFEGRVPGFPSRAEALDRYAAQSGHHPEHLDFHEVFALARALAINDRHQRLAGSRRRRENPMIAVIATRLEGASS